jgi:hypothetical protein
MDVSRTLLCFLAMLIVCSPGHGQIPDEINPPFGLYWGQSEKKIQAIMLRAGAKITHKEVVQSRDTWTVTGLIQPALKETVLYFGTEKTLVEVELRYEHPDWNLVAYDEFLNSARARLEAKYGPPTVLARNKKPQGDVMETVVGYQWKGDGSSIELFFYSAERNSDVFRSISVHYRSG